MEKVDVIKLLGYIKASYPQWARNLKAADASIMIEVWTDALVDCNPEYVRAAAKAHVTSEKWPPSIAEILERVRLISSGGNRGMTGMEAWSLVRVAIKNGNYHSKEEFERLPEIVQTAIGNHHSIKEWAAMAVPELETVVQSQFIKSFGSKQKVAKDHEALPADVKALIANVANGMRLLE